MTTDYQSRINAYRDQASQQRARAARRAAKAELWARLPELLGRGSAKTASGWNLPVTPDETERGRPIGNQHPGTAAVIVVRQALGQYKLPSEVDLRYVGMKRISGHGSSAMDEGIVVIEANFQATSGPKFAVDVPVIVHEGRMLDPSILIHAGNPRVITQNTFDDILGLGEFTMQTPDRPHMYSPPPDKGDRRPRERVKIHRPGMFDVPPPRSLMQNKLRASVRASLRADISSAVTGVRGKVRRAQVEWVEPARQWLTESGHDVGDVWLMREHELFRQLNQLYPGGAGAFIAQYSGGGMPGQEVAADAVMGIAAQYRPPYGEDEPAWADTGDTGWGGESESVAPEPEWADSGSGGAWGETPNEVAEPAWADEGAGGGAWGAMDPTEAAHQFLYEMPDFDWSEEQVAAAHQFAEQNGVDLSEFMTALNDAEYAKARPEHAPSAPGGGGPGGGGPVESYDTMRSISPLDDPEAGKHGDAPPGREQQVLDLKEEPGVDNPYAVAWDSYNKSHDKHSDGPGQGAPPKKHFPTLDTPKPPPAPAPKKHFPTLASRGSAGGGERVGFYSPDVVGVVKPGELGRNIPGADGSHLDVGERPVAGAWGVGQRVRTTKMVVTRDRGGVRYAIPKGTSGTVLRDVDGANRVYYVKFPELGYSATVSKEALR